VVWVAATSLREADGDADHISRADLDRVRQTDLELLGGVAGISADRVVDAALGIFDLYDGDGDGQLSFVELSVGLLTLASLVTLGSAHADLDEEARLRATFAVLDVDGSGRLEERELVAWVRALAKLGGVLGAQTETAAPARPGAAARFMSHPAESSAAAETIVAGWLRELDTDGDGTLSREEFARLAPRLRLGRAVAHLTGAAEAPKHKT
jgi:Ca2+-binding EF-hand superfamily protein